MTGDDITAFTRLPLHPPSASRLPMPPRKMMDIMQCTLRIASEVDLEDLLPMVGRYHETEGIVTSPSLRRGALSALIREPRYGDAVPEPSTYALMGLGGLVIVVAWRRKIG